MKKTQKAMIAVLLTMLLVGCSTQEPLPEAEVTIPEVTTPQATEAPEKVLTTVSKDTTPTTATEELQSASETAATEPEEKASIVKAEESVPEKSKAPEKPVPKPQATEPKETTPVETQPAETKTQATEPPVTKPAVTEVPTTEPTQPPVTEPPATEPEPTKPTPTETVPEETAPTEPPAEVIDTAALEAYGRSYASSTYGYNGTSACTPGTGAGYFPAATKEITSMEDGRSYVRQAIDSQYKRDKAYGYLPYEEIDGKTVRCPINVSVSPAGGNTYTICVYYGGTA